MIEILIGVVYIFGAACYLEMALRKDWGDSAGFVMCCVAIWPVSFIFAGGMALTSWLADRYDW